MASTIEPKQPQDDNALLRQRAHEWRLLLEGGNADARDHRDFEDWLAADERHQQAFARASSVWDALGFVQDEQWDARLRSKAACPDPAKRDKAGVPARFWLGFPRPVLTTAFAVVALVLSFTWNSVIQQAPDEANAGAGTATMRTYVSETSQTRRIELSDGSVVTLGAGSRINVHIRSTERHIQLLSGAALFDVATDHDRPFTVQAGALTAHALGTIFDVRLNGGVARVSVAEGIVGVHYASISSDDSDESSQTKLKAGEQVVADLQAGLSEVHPTEVASVGAWSSKRLVYIGATLKELVADANRYGDQTIVLGDLDAHTLSMKVTGSFAIGDVDALLATLPDLFPIAILSSSAPQSDVANGAQRPALSPNTALIVSQRGDEGQG
ncbi:MAG: FecR domain-containing protein [Pseudomonadota bacterium]